MAERELDPDEGRSVKSTAVVKYASMQYPAQYIKLDPRTNLNNPPENWLRGDPSFVRYIQDITTAEKKTSQFSSFDMAHSCLDLVDDLDVITDAENIKKLLKIRYNKGPVSMMVHRVGKTLLLDQFDIHKHLLRKQQDEWEWLRKFFYETVMQNMTDKEKACVERKNRSRDLLQNRNMLSKFLYYSVEGQKPQSESGSDSLYKHQSHDSTPRVEVLPEPHRSQFARTVMWTFEDIRMLIGTDLPIFGCGTHPCVSLRLRDKAKPINILTGIDYWLDNLMCNVPELAMCYHLNGIVQSYEVMPTEDIPNMTHSQFNPFVVRDVAQNILSFLKTNATKEGHTYWLFKGSDSDVVKLYDLTSLCAHTMNDSDQNPFAIHVGLLLFRVAQNMKFKEGPKKENVIRILLKNCIGLLDFRQHFKTVGQAHYYLSDLYIADGICDLDSACPTLSQWDISSEGDDDYDDSSQCHDMTEVNTSSTVNIHALATPGDPKVARSEYDRFPSISPDVEDRCREALTHVLEGLRCVSEGRSAMPRNRSDPIPMPYEPLSKTTNNQSDSATSSTGDDATSSAKHPLSDAAPLSGDTDHVEDSAVCDKALLRRTSVGHYWQESGGKCDSLPQRSSFRPRIEDLLWKKASLSYYWLAQTKNTVKKYGQALKYAKLALISFTALQRVSNDFRTMSGDDATSCYDLRAAILTLAGDIRLMLVHNNGSLVSHQEEFVSLSEADQKLLLWAKKEVEEFELSWACEYSLDVEQSLRDSLKCYEHAQQCFMGRNVASSKQQHHLLKRMGNILNELGVFLMNRAKNLAELQGDVNVSQLELLWKQSYDCFDRGIKNFEIVGDRVNEALLYSNRGRLMRICCSSALVTGEGDKGEREFTQREKHYLTKAADNYTQALVVLGQRVEHTDIWDLVSWELSSTYFTMATMMQDYAPLSTHSKEQVEREVTDLMAKSLKHCDTETKSSRQPMCQYRAATINHRLASLYHSSYRNQPAEQKRKHLRSLAEIHYCKAFKQFTLTESCCELLRVQLERVAMCEFILQAQTSHGTKIKTLHTALELLIDCHPAAESLRAQLAENSEESFRTEGDKLMTILDSRLKVVLHTLVKTETNSKRSKLSETELEAAKALFKTYLQERPQLWESSPLLEKCLAMSVILEKLRGMVDNSKGEG